MNRKGAELLLDMVDGVRGLPFVWGRTDCMMLTARAVQLTNSQGHSPYDEWLEKYTDLRGAMKFLRDIGNVGIYLRDHYGAQSVPRNFDQTGDVMLTFDPGGRMCAHVCLGAHVLSSSEELGVFIAPVGQVRKHAVLENWRIA